MVCGDSIDNQSKFDESKSCTSSFQSSIFELPAVKELTAEYIHCKQLLLSEVLLLFLSNYCFNGFCPEQILYFTLCKLFMIDTEARIFI